MAHEGPFKSMAPRLFGSSACTALRSAARTFEQHTTAPTHGHDLTASPAGSGARRQGLASTTIRPLQELARAVGWTFLLTTHF
jgi:hypothetical protein